MLWSVMAAVAVAGESVPVTCEAVFIGPAETCSLSGEWMASGTAPTEAVAKKRALARLTEATELATAAHALKTAGTMASAVAEQQVVTCPSAVAEQVRVSCFPSLDLTMPQTCFADFPEEECPDTAVVILEGIGVKVMEKARQQICRDVDRTLNASTLSEAQRLSCQSHCLVKSRVRCR